MYSLSRNPRSMKPYHINIDRTSSPCPCNPVLSPCNPVSSHWSCYLEEEFLKNSCDQIKLNNYVVLLGQCLRNLFS
jgi:hypothetical protein